MTVLQSPTRSILFCRRLHHLFFSQFARERWRRPTSTAAAASAAAAAAAVAVQRMEAIGGELAIEGWRVRAVSHFPTVRLGGLHLGRRRSLVLRMRTPNALCRLDGLMSDLVVIQQVAKAVAIIHTAGLLMVSPLWERSSATYGDRWYGRCGGYFA